MTRKQKPDRQFVDKRVQINLKKVRSAGFEPAIPSHSNIAALLSKYPTPALITNFCLKVNSNQSDLLLSILGIFKPIKIVKVNISSQQCSSLVLHL